MSVELLQVAEAEARREAYSAQHDAFASIAAAATAAEGSFHDAIVVGKAMRAFEAQKQEWRQMAEGARDAVKADQERRFTALSEEKDAVIRDREAKIEQMQDIVGAKERALADMYKQLAAADDNTQQLLRAQRREMAVEREDLKQEGVRLSGLRERMRVQSEAALNARDAQKALAESATHRAAAVERSSSEKAVKLVMAGEEAARSRVVDAAADFFDLVASVRQLTRATVTAAERSTAGRIDALRLHIAAKDAEDEARPADGDWDDVASSEGTATPRSTLGTPRDEAQAHKALLRREQALAKTLRKQSSKRRAAVRASANDNAELRRVIEALKAQLEQQESAMELVKHSSTERVNALTERCAQAEAKLTALRQEHSDAAATRAKARSQAGVLETLIQEHDEETAELRRQLAEAEDRARQFARDNKHDALNKERATNATLQKERDLLAREAAGLRAKVSALESTVTNDQTGAAKLTAENRRLTSSALDVRSSADMRVGSYAAAAQDANFRATEAEERAEAAELRAENAEGQLGELTAEHNRVREQLAKAREALSEAEQRASELERDERLAIDREQERSRDRTALRQAAAAAAEQARREAEENDDRHPDEVADEPAASAAAPAATSSSSQGGEPDCLKLGDFAAADAAIAALETKVLLAKRERDTLRRQLGVAMAEVSAAEERRANTVQKYLALLNSSDAAPRRELALRQQETALRQLESQLATRGDELDRRELETKKREIALGSRATALNKLSKKLEQGGGHHGVMALPMRQRTETGSVVSGGTSALMSPAGERPSKLTPLIHRPPASVTPPNITHPQLPPRTSPLPGHHGHE